MAYFRAHSKVETEVEIKANVEDIFHICSGRKAHLAPKLCPEIVHKVDLHEGDWETHGSIKVWTFVAGKVKHK
ncbi:hypothetical protein U1Q18_041709 [Sarracenia purpurea var. burkii]